MPTTDPDGRRELAPRSIDFVAPHALGDAGGGPRSVAAIRLAVELRILNALTQVLQRGMPGVFRLIADRDFAADLVQEMFGPAGASRNADAKPVAELFAQALETTRGEHEALAAPLPRPDMWVPMAFDAAKLRALGVDVWVQQMAGRLDLARTFPGLRPADAGAALRAIHAALTAGDPGRTGQGGSVPILRFKSTEDWQAAREAFGFGNIWTAMLETLRRLAARIAELQALGSAATGVIPAIDPEQADAATRAADRSAREALAASGTQAIMAMPEIVAEIARLRHRKASLFAFHHDRCIDLIGDVAAATGADTQHIARLLRAAMDGIVEPFLGAGFASDAAPGTVSRVLVERFRWSPPVWRLQILRSAKARMALEEGGSATVIDRLLAAIVRFPGWPALYRQAAPAQGAVEVAGIGALLAGTLVAGWMRLAADAVSEGYDRRRFVRPDGNVEAAMLARAFSASGAAGIYADFLVGETARYDPALEAITGRSAALGPTDTASLRRTLDTTPFINLAYARPALDYLVLAALREAVAPGFRRRLEEAPPPHRGSLLYPRSIPNSGNAT